MFVVCLILAEFFLGLVSLGGTGGTPFFFLSAFDIYSLHAVPLKPVFIFKHTIIIFNYANNNFGLINTASIDHFSLVQCP